MSDTSYIPSESGSSQVDGSVAGAVRLVVNRTYDSTANKSSFSVLVQIKRYHNYNCAFSVVNGNTLTANGTTVLTLNGNTVNLSAREEFFELASCSFELEHDENSDLEVTIALNRIGLRDTIGSSPALTMYFETSGTLTYEEDSPSPEPEPDPDPEPGPDPEPVASVARITLFDNTNTESVVNEEIWFDQAPVIVATLSASSGLTIVSSSVNSAILTGRGTLTGIPYTHTTRILTSTKSGGDKDKTATVKNCTLVNTINSNNLLLRLAAYYQPDGLIRTIKNSIVYKDQRCGRAYSFKNPFEEDEIAYLASMNITASAVFKADCEWRGNYEPAGQQGLYKHCIILDAATFAEDGGTFTVPEEVFESENPQIRVVMISGGTGGGSGWPGENGDDAMTYTDFAQDGDVSGVWYGAEGGDGGQGGTGGTPGRVYSVTIENPDATYRYTIGTGGEGGAATGFKPDTVSELRAALQNENPSGTWTDTQIQAIIAQENTSWTGSPNAGSDGTASAFGSYSSNDTGSYVPTGGVYEPISGKFFAVKGNTGIRGGKGGARRVASGMAYNWVTDGEDVIGDDGTVYHGGRTGRPYTSVPGLPEANLIAYGGNGAGAAVGLDRADHPHMDGGSDQSAAWEVTTD